jgi:hypothetical protein
VGRVSVSTDPEGQTFKSGIEVCDPFLDYGVGVIPYHITEHLKMLFLKVGFRIHIHHVQISLAYLYNNNTI